MLEYRKIGLLERTLHDRDKTIEILQSENEQLKSKLKDIEQREKLANDRISAADKLIKEQQKLHDEMATMRDKYRDAMYEALDDKKEYGKKLQGLIDRLESYL